MNVQMVKEINNGMGVRKFDCGSVKFEILY